MLFRRELCEFLSAYPAAILVAGSTTERCEKTVYRIAGVYGGDAEMTILPRTVTVTIRDRENGEFCAISKPLKMVAVDFHRISLLSQLSWDIRDERIPLVIARKRFRDIVHKKRIGRLLSLLLISMANASWCRLFDGDYAGVVIVFIATVCGLLLRDNLTGRYRWDVRIATLMAACCSSCLVSAAFLLHWTATEDVALGTCVLYLVPGIMFINSVSDMVNGHLLYSFSRFINACVLTACLGMGLSLGILLMNFELFSGL